MSATSKARRVLIVGTTTCTALLGATCDPVAPNGARSTLVVVAGDVQATLPGGRLPRPLVVRALDAAGLPRAGILVRWSGSTESSFELSSLSRTDAGGIASAIWLLGSTPGTYTARAETDSLAGVEFSAVADPAALTISAVPDTVRFRALDDTATIRIRVRTANGALDTLIDPLRWGSQAEKVAEPVYIDGRLVLVSLRNGMSNQHVLFGKIGVPLPVIVQQVPVDARIVRLGSDLPNPDTLVIGPDSAQLVGVVAVDSRGRSVEDSSATAGVAWQASNPSAASVEHGLASGVGVVRGIADGSSTITARVDTRERRLPVRVWTLRASAIAVGGGSTCALLQDGRLACWGFREVGNNSVMNVALAPEPRNVGPFRSLSMAENGGCALATPGAAHCWGRNEGGQLGTGGTGSYVSSPVGVSGGLTFASIAAGPATSCGLTTAARVYCWGSGGSGALGDGSYGAKSCTYSWCTPAPTEIAGGRSYTQLTVGSGHACALTSEGRAYCWGTNRYGQLGSPLVKCAGYHSGDTATSNNWCSTVPVEVDGDHRFKTISAGIIYTCGITTDDALFCWGNNVHSVLGVADAADGAQTVNARPLAVAPERRFASVYAGRSHTCAIDSEGAAWCWGQGFAGQLGTGASNATGQCATGPCERTPVQVAGGLTFRALSLASSFTCGLTADSVAYCWGWGGSGALGTGVKSNWPAPVRVVFQKR